MKYESPQTPICSGTGSVIDTSKIFRVGDIVKTVPHPLFGAKSYTGKIDTIVDIDDRVDAMYPYKLKKLNMWIHPNELEHYIEEKEEVMEEKEVGEEDNFPTKELDLCEILRDYKGEKIYILSHGYMTVMGGIIGTVELEGTGEHGETLNLVLNYDGTHIKGTEVIAFPSRALYEKYPLDAYSAWMEWKSERTAKRWRAEESEFYYRIDTYFEAREETEWHLSSHDNILYEIGNYFRTKELAQQAAEAVRECLMKFHEQQPKQ